MKNTVTTVLPAALLITALALVACTDNKDETPVAGSANPSASVEFPPAEARFSRDAIPVHGRLENAAPESVRITVDAGAGAVDAAISADGSWIAEAVPLSPNASNTLTVVAEGDDGWQQEFAASTLHREVSETLPLTMVPGSAEGNLVFFFATGEMREYNSEGSLLHQFMFPTPGAVHWFTMTTLPATGEVIVPVSHHRQGGCDLFALDMAKQSLRELYRFIWPATEGNPRTCSRVRLSAFGEERLVLSDHAAKQLLVIDADGAVLSSRDNPATQDIGGHLLTPSSPMNVGHLYRTIDSASHGGVGRIEIDTFDIASGDTIDFYLGEFRDVFDDMQVEPKAIGENIYFMIDDRPGYFTANPIVEHYFDVTGYKANDVYAIASLSASEAAHINEYGRVSKLDLSSGRSEFLFDLNTFIAAPYLTFLDTSNDDRRILLHSQHTLSRALFSATYDRRHWRSLYSFDLETLTLQQVYATTGTRDSLSLAAVTQNKDFSIVPEGRPDQPPLLQIDHSTGARTPLDFPGLEWSDKHSFITSLDGEYIVVTSPDSIAEYSTESLQLTRKFQLNPLSGFLSNHAVRARFPGEQGAIYLSHRKGSSIFRLNFDTGQMEQITGLDRGEGPLIGLGIYSARMSWSVEENAVYIAHDRRPKIWRVDLDSGDRSEVYDATDDSADLPDAFSSIRHLAGRNALLASDSLRAYYLDLQTGASVILPMHVRN